MLVIRLGAIGDVVRTLPAVSALRAALPGAHLAWLVEPAARTAVAWVDEAITFPRDELEALLRRGRALAALRRLARFGARLRERRFDLVLDFHGILKSGWLALATRAPVRVGYAAPFAREGAWLFATERVRPAARPLPVDPAARERIAAALGDDVSPIALQPGSSAATPHKRWSPARYAAVARRLRDETGIASIVLAGPTDGERALAASIVADTDGAARLAPETRTLPELAALLAQSRLYVGGDTGPLHVASLVGTPVVQILGPTDPIENAPWTATPSRTLREPVACSPCRRGCAAAPCMQRVSPEAVVAAARALLALGPRGC